MRSRKESRSFQCLALCFKSDLPPCLPWRVRTSDHHSFSFPDAAPSDRSWGPTSLTWPPVSPLKAKVSLKVWLNRVCRSRVCAESAVQSSVVLDTLLLLMVLGHVPFFNFNKCWLVSMREFSVGIPVLRLCLLSSNDLLLGLIFWGDSACWRKWLQKFKYSGHLRDSNSQQLLPEIVTLQSSLF